MKPEQVPCDRQLLRQSLSDLLTDLQEDTLAQHLSECETCQHDLECLAAEQSEWSRVTEILKQESRSIRSDPTEDDSPRLTEPWNTGGESHLAPAGGPRVSAIDFAVDFLDPSTTSQAMGRLGDIDIYEVIGRGGMGIVLRGFQRELNRPVAVKVLAPHLATSGAARKRFAREAQATAVIVHPNVMPILTVHSSGKLPYLVMPYVACESLEQRLDRGGPLATVDVLRIATQIASGLAAAHAQGLVHRDIKPANVLLEKGVDRAMLTDFGLARAVDDASLTRTGSIAGTPQFMSPEQARGDSVDARSDLFSLGSVMYVMSTGRPPFRAETSYGILRRVTDTEPRAICEINADIPEWLGDVIEKLHQKDPTKRFQTAGEFASLLEGCLAHVQQPTAVMLPAPVTSLQARKSTRPSVKPPGGRGGQHAVWRSIVRPRNVLAVAMLVVVLLAVSLMNRTWWNSLRSNRGTSSRSSVQSRFAKEAGSDFATWHDRSVEELLDLERDTTQLETDNSQFWAPPKSPQRETQNP